MANDQYIYAVTRVHTHELHLLNRQDLEQLIAAKSVAECFQLLSDKGRGSSEIPAGDADALIEREREKTWAFIEELAGGLAPFHVFRYSNDFHNLKAAIKLVYSGLDAGDTARYFLGYGTVEPARILEAARKHEFSELPPAMAQAGQKAYEALAHTGNGQSCDMIIDYAALLAIAQAGEESGSEVLRQYSRLTVDVANIKAAVRSCRMGKQREFLQRAIVPAGSLNSQRLIAAAEQGLDEIYAYLERTDYSQTVQVLRKSMASFESWCDSRLMEHIRPQRYRYSSLEPLAAYILGRENEIAMVRLILSAKINQLSEELLRERLRELYV